MDYIDAKITKNVMTRVAVELVGKVIDDSDKDGLAHSLKDLGLLREKQQSSISSKEQGMYLPPPPD